MWPGVMQAESRNSSLQCRAAQGRQGSFWKHVVVDLMTRPSFAASEASKTNRLICDGVF